jgi:hypothetical protein
MHAAEVFSSRQQYAAMDADEEFSSRRRYAAVNAEEDFSSRQSNAWCSIAATHAEEKHQAAYKGITWPGKGRQHEFTLAANSSVLTGVTTLFS